jgi:hypothetical protein
MSDKDELFIGWAAKAPVADRRFLLVASLGLVAAAGLAGAGFAARRPGPQPGRWDQGKRARYTGTLIETPYPTLISRDGAGLTQSMLLVGYDKVALPRRGLGPVDIDVEASAITRGRAMMLAVSDVAGFAQSLKPASYPLIAEEDLGPASLFGEIVDAKCWFGAMNPGIGLTHKACAALCLRGGLPLAFCQASACGEDEEVHLFVNEAGAPHGSELAAFLADPVLAEGRLVRRNGIVEFRVAQSGVRRV